jgi:serine/threonine-protein kinase
MRGERLGPWIIDEELGRGGMGVVYLAHRDPAGNPGAEPSQAAIKVLAAELAVESGFLHRFQREIDVLKQLDHPHIVRFFESGQEGSRYYYAMEYVAGPSYEQLLERQGRLPWREVLELAWQIAPALKHAHDRGIIHRDLKPSNLMLAPTPDRGTGCQPDQLGGQASCLSSETGEQGGGVVKLTDFGVASLFASPHLTITGGVIGTPEYLSPEQAAGKPVTRRSDLYSLGVVLYTLVTGRNPFEGEPLDLLHKHRFGQFDRPSRIAPDLHHEFEQIICQLLEKDPGQRPADGGVLFRRLDSLRRKLQFQAQHQAGEPTHSPRSRPSTVIAPSNVEGPATLMSRLMRQELDQQNKGGPLARFINRPWVLVSLFLLSVGLIVWGFWPVSPDKLYRRGAALMASSNPEDWEEGWKHLERLKREHPDNPHGKELAEFEQRIRDYREERQAEKAARNARPLSEAEWFYQRGLRQRQSGDEGGAKQTWRALIEGFRDVPAENPWVRRAEQELEKEKAPTPEERWRSLREAVKRARALRQQGKVKEANTILDALRQLYKDDAAAQALLGEK